MKKLYFLIFTFSFLGYITEAQQLLRGPYQQKKTPNSMNIRWRTADSLDAKVYYGTDLNNLNLTATVSTLENDHDVELKNLSPYTKYFYKIESGGNVLSGPDTAHWFRTAPVAGTVQPIRVWATGDFGKGNDGQRLTRDAYLNYSKDKETDVWIWLGDNAYQDGADSDYQAKVFEQYYAYGDIFKFMHFYPSPGNHDYHSVCGIPCQQDPRQHKGPYYSIITAPQQGEAGGEPSTLENYYSFDYGNAHFISLNSELGSPTAAYDWIGAYTNGASTSPMIQWLKDDLSKNTQPWVIAYWHQPPYTKGSHDSDLFYEIYMKAIREKITPILEQYGVDLVVNGHSHAFERSYLLKGLTGTAATFNAQTNVVNGTSGKESLGEAYIKYTDGTEPNKGTVYVVCGNSGSDVAANKALFYNGSPHPAMFYWDGGTGVCGSFIIDIDGNKLTGRYLTSNNVVKDEFTIKKQSVTGIKNINSITSSISDAKVFPNPFAKNATLSFTLSKPMALNIELFSTDGKMSRVLSNSSFNEGEHSIEINSDALHLSKGEYIVKINEGKSASFERLFKVD
ncbi:MAG: metallophosphoesterase [Chitinophagales bacterium]|nr:metallophosphoesterase [Chitinophagales bacterium]